MKMAWWYDDGNIVKKVWQMDRRTENTIHRAAWSQQKKNKANLRDLIAAIDLVTWFSQCVLEIGHTTLKKNRTPLLCSARLGVSFHSHLQIESGVYSRNFEIEVKLAISWPVWLKNLMDDFETRILYDIEIGQMTLKNNMASFLCPLNMLKLYATFHSHLWIETRIIIRKRSNLCKI